jgi:hypothetical protein
VNIILKNMTSGASVVGLFVRSYNGGFIYAKEGETPIGVVAESVPRFSSCRIITEGDALVKIKGSAVPGNTIRAALPGEGLSAGVAGIVSNETEYTSLGVVLKGGTGEVRASVNIGGGSAAPASAQGAQGIQGPLGTYAQGIGGIQGYAGLPPGAQTGPQGYPGYDGIDGVQGIDGIQGVQGPSGIQGNSGIQGPGGSHSWCAGGTSRSLWR